MANPILTYDAVILSPGFDLRITGAGTQNITASYTDNTSSGGTPPSTAMAYCDVNIRYSNVSWVLNNDNSVTVTGTIQNASLTRTRAWTGNPGYSYEIWTRFNEQETFRTEVIANQAGTWDLNVPRSFSITVPPRSTASTASVHYFNKSVGYQYAADEFTVGLIVENPNYPDYRPGKIYSDSEWKSHNRSTGFEKIYTSSSTTREMRTQNGGTGTGNPPVIYSAVWKNQRKIGSE